MRSDGDIPARVLAVLGLLLAVARCDPGTRDTPPERPGAGPSAPRVVSLTPLATRFVIAIGAGERLVAVDPASAEIPGIPTLPITNLDGASRLRPDLLLVAALPEAGNPGAAALQRAGTRIVEFAPHDFEDALPLVRQLGAELTDAQRAGRFEVAFSSPLAAIGGSSEGQFRPRVVAVIRFNPLEVAGGHSFETDLIEIAGGHSVTHPGSDFRLAIDADRWAELAPDLVLVIGAPPASPREEQAVRNALPPGPAVAFFAFDPGFWIDASDEPARRLRAVIEPIAVRLQTAGRAGSRKRGARFSKSARTASRRSAQPQRMPHTIER